MKIVVILLSGMLLLLGSCKHDDGQSTAPENPATPEPENRKSIATDFPLLPVIEGPLWQKLQDAKAVILESEVTEEQRSEAVIEVNRITELFQKRHPFQQEGNRTTLGGIVFDRVSGKIEIPVVVYYPKEGDDRHPGELELVLCSEAGRSHETLFTTETRPLHLELLLHLAGYKKSPPASTFRVEVVIPNHDPIPIEALIRSIGNETLPEHLSWEFSGSDSKDPYQPDMTGDFLICWHAHDSVLRIRHEKIASGEIKLKAADHPALKQHQEAMLVLSPK